MDWRGACCGGGPSLYAADNGGGAKHVSARPRCTVRQSRCTRCSHGAAEDRRGRLPHAEARAHLSIPEDAIQTCSALKFDEMDFYFSKFQTATFKGCSSTTPVESPWRSSAKAASGGRNGTNMEVFVAPLPPARRAGALFLAAERGNLPVVTLLIQHQPADEAVDAATTRDGDTALHFAARGQKSHVVAWLVKHGADPRRRNNAGQTPIDAAGGCAETLKALVLGCTSSSDKENRRGANGGFGVNVGGGNGGGGLGLHHGDFDPRLVSSLSASSTSTVSANDGNYRTSSATPALHHARAPTDTTVAASTHARQSEVRVTVYRTTHQHTMRQKNPSINHRCATRTPSPRLII